MNRMTTVVAGVGTGAAAMYFLDPQRGARRRAILRDKIVRGAHKSADGLAAASRDIANRSAGVVASTRGRLTDQPVPDDVLVARVRSALGRSCSHPRAIEVIARNGYVTLRGPILAQEADQTVSAVRAVRGVEAVAVELELYDRPENVPALQGGGPRPAGTWSQSNWSPTARMLAAGSGLTLLGYCMSRRNKVHAEICGWVGAGLLARAATNMELKRLVGVGAGRQAVEITKTISIDRPVDEVFRFWESCEQFPAATAHVREVRPTRVEGQSHWVVQLPPGVATVQFDALLTRRIENELLAWRSAEGAVVGHAGIVRFDPNPDGSTRVQLRVSYNPPIGAIGHSLAWLLGTDLKSLLAEELGRIKTYLETGRAPHDAAQPAKSGKRDDSLTSAV